MEKQTEVKSFEVRQYCDKCGEELTFTGEVLLSYPEKYVHKCKKCGNTKWFTKSYPCIEYKENKPECSALTFTLNETEAQEYHDFCNKHKSCEFSSTTGGKISITFTPSGLGDVIVVKCNKCGKEKDITDISNW